jgi:hypothetical protein
MPVMEESWNPIAQSLGYKNERDMLLRLYEHEQFSITQIAKVVGYAAWTVRRRLVQQGIKIRGRGGPNHTQRKLQHVSDADIFNLDVSQVAIKYDCNESSVYSERRLRRINDLIQGAHFDESHP